MAQILYPPSQNALQKTLDAQLDQGHTTALTLNNVTGIQNKPGVLVINRISSAGVLLEAARREYIKYTAVSGSTLTGLTRALGGSSDQEHGIGSVVEFISDVTLFQALIDAFLIEHGETGAHTDITADSIDINSTIAVDGVLDEDDMASNSATKLPTQQSVKAYVDNEISDISLASDGWQVSGDTWTYASATSFTIAGVDRTAVFKKGTKIKLTQTSAKYFYVTSSSFSTNTTVNITGGSDYTLANAAITSPYYSYASNPQGFPHWFNWTVTVNWDGTDPSGTTTTVAKFRVEGDTCFIYFRQNNTVAGATNTQVDFTGPIVADNTTNEYALIGTGLASTLGIDQRPNTAAFAYIYSSTPTIYIFFTSIAAKAVYCNGFYRI